MNTANKLTLLRVVMIPAFLLVLYLDFPGANYAALVIFALASITDTLTAISPGTTTRSPILASLWTLWRTNAW